MMNLWTLAIRGVRFHARAHFGVLAGAIIGAAILTGALVVGDSVRESLRQIGLLRLGKVQYALPATDRFFRAALADDLTKVNGADAPLEPLLHAFGTGLNVTSQARANQVHLYGVRPAFWSLADSAPAWDDSADAVWLNESLADQIKVAAGDTVLFRIKKPSALSREAPITPKSDTSTTLRLRVAGILTARQLGNFSLSANQVPPNNAFLSLATLQRALDRKDRANMLVVKGDSGKLTPISDRWQLADAELELNPLTNSPAFELRSPRIFLDDPVARAALGASGVGGTNLPQPILTYLANQLRLGTNSAPYSMVTAAGIPLTPMDMRDDEIILNAWLAEDLNAKPGSEIAMTYFLPESAGRLAEGTNLFRVKAVVPMSVPWLDRDLMPDFPGLAKAESTHDWDAGFPLVHKIRDKDEAYWKQYRGSPKAFITLKAGQTIWGNRFGHLTAIRFPSTNGNPSAVITNVITSVAARGIASRVMSRLNPAELGLRFDPVRDQAITAASQSQDFGGLFIGFSLFLIVAALLLMSLLYQLGLEQRVTEMGTLMALGFTSRRLRWLLTLEGIPLALIGGIVGTAGGVVYADAMLRGLTTLWKSAVGTSALSLHLTAPTLIAGLAAGIVVNLFVIWFATRKFASRTACELLSGENQPVPPHAPHSFVARLKAKLGRASVVGPVALAGALAMTAWGISTKQMANPGAFFGAGTLLLIAGLAGLSVLLRSFETSEHVVMSLRALGIRGCARRRKRSLSTAAMLACGCFIIAAIGVFRLDENLNSSERSSGTGGFALIGETALPVIHDLNTREGREFYGLNDADMTGVTVIPLRVRDGDDASCLNLNRAQKPRLLGVKPESLAGRFTFAGMVDGFHGTNGWDILKGATTNAPSRANQPLSQTAAVGDAASIQWALGRQVGDALDFADEKGQTFPLRLAGGIANSILQGNLLIDEREFLLRYPGENGYRMFLIDAPSNRVAQVSALLSRALQDVGLELTPAPKRLAAFNAVQNTYLGAFQILGGLGLLLGSAGLGVVVLRNVLERRGELALLQAVGFRQGVLRWLVVIEHGALLLFGLGIGLIAALVAVAPALASPGARLPFLSLGITLVAVFLSGLLWTWLATRWALRGSLLAALRNE